ncbi:MAG: glycosyl hydrolase [Acidobacteriota bacterium]
MRRDVTVVVCALVGAVALAAAGPVAAQGVKVDADTFGGLEARAIGPATMGGRIAALDAVSGDRLTIFAASAGGGVWKSVDGGLMFTPVFDKHTQAIGAIAIDPANPKTVWVGTGESWLRNSVSPGDGVYRSTDGGDSWTRLGLEQTERIARIVLVPKNPDAALVCATGHAFDDHPDRGVFRTRDGGKTWEKTLYVAPDVGCADLSVDPQDPNTVYAAMWQHRRQPWFFTSGGPKSGLYRSRDGGATWDRLAKGLPEGDLGRIAIAVAPSKSSTVYASVEASKTALYRSDDRGETWRKVSDSTAVTVRPFYFSRLVADPVNAERVYKMGQIASVSDDGGKTFSGLGGGSIMGSSYHSDVHDIWINPKNPEHLVIGTDGGVYMSYDRGSTFRFVASLPVGQFYHVSYDMARPYNVYGGLQDNSTWYGPSRRSGGIANREWRSLTGGDGFWAFPDPSDADIVFDESQGGNLFRVRKSTLESKDIKPTPKAGEPRYRFNWNTPIHMSPNEPGVIYYGAQFLFRSRDKGESWERISPDLTTNDPEKLKQHESGGLTLDDSTAENHCTIFGISESPRNKNVVWVGTDDGNVQVTRDGGKAWTNVAANITGVPRHTWVSSVEAGRFAEGTAFITLEGHMTGDAKTYVYRTDDFGSTWTALATPDMRGYAHVVKQDLVNPDLLFAGTEFGLYISLDGGKGWGQFTGGVPNVAVWDVAIHPREHDLIVATHGRSLYILDDITPLRKLTAQTLDSDVAFLESRPSPQINLAMEFGFNGDSEFLGRSPNESAVIAYYLKKRHVFGDLKLEIYDASGALLTSLTGGKRRGVNRVEWPMRSKPPRTAPGEGIIPSMYALMGLRAPAGTYTVKMLKGKETFSSTVTLVPDPSSKHTEADRAAQRAAAGQLYALMEKLGALVDGLTSVRDQAKTAVAGLSGKDPLRTRVQALADDMEAQRKSLVASQRGEGISGEEKLREELGMLYGNVNGYEGRPTQSQMDRMAVLDADLAAATTRFAAAATKQSAAFNAQLVSKKLAPINVPAAAAPGPTAK